MQTKLRLNLEDLTVDSFDTTRPSQKQGTVFGEQYTGPADCDAALATEGYTCDDPSCDDNCNTRNPCPTVLFTNCAGYLCA